MSDGDAGGEKPSMSKSERNAMDYQRRKARKLEEAAAEAAAGAAAKSAQSVHCLSLANAADAGLSDAQLRVKRMMGGERALCRGECHWYECWLCMRFYVPDKDVCDHPAFAAGGARAGQRLPVKGFI
jgi:hypothetical protein